MSLRAALRAATASAHDALEAALGLDPHRLTRPHYAAALQVLHAVRAGWHPGLARFFPNLADAPVTWLAQDLHALAVAPLPPVPMLSLSPDEAWGMRYVLEGSALGGRVLVRTLAPLGLTPAHGARYFEGAGTATGTQWAVFLSELEQAGTPAATPRIVQGALRSFEALTRCAAVHLRTKACSFQVEPRS